MNNKVIYCRVYRLSNETEHAVVHKFRFVFVFVFLFVFFWGGPNNW